MNTFHGPYYNFHFSLMKTQKKFYAPVLIYTSFPFLNSDNKAGLKTSLRVHIENMPLISVAL